MDTRSQIIETASRFLVDRGFNAFSYKSIAEEVGVKTSSIHYYFPSKGDLGIAIVGSHKLLLEQWKNKSSAKGPVEKMNAFLKYYRNLAAEGKVCIMGSLMSDVNTLDQTFREELLDFGRLIVEWLSGILDEGNRTGEFKHINDTKEKATLILASVMGIVQISRIEKNSLFFDEMLRAIMKDLLSEI